MEGEDEYEEGWDDGAKVELVKVRIRMRIGVQPL